MKKLNKKQIEKEYQKILDTQLLASDFDIEDVHELSIKEKIEFLKNWYENK